MCPPHFILLFPRARSAKRLSGPHAMPSNIGTGISKSVTIDGTDTCKCSTITSNAHSNPPMRHARPAKRIRPADTAGLARFDGFTLPTIGTTPRFDKRNLYMHIQGVCQCVGGISVTHRMSQFFANMKRYLCPFTFCTFDMKSCSEMPF